MWVQHSEDNLIDICIDELLDQLLRTDYQVVLRPHPQFFRYSADRIEELREKYSHHPNFTLEEDFSSIRTVYMADALITDWSGIAFEYSFSKLKPTLFVNAPMPVMNPEWKKIDVVPLDIALRKLIGEEIELEEIGTINCIVKDFIENAELYAEKIAQVRTQEISCLGRSGKVGGEYILKAIERIEDNKEDYMKYDEELFRQ